MPRPRPFSRNDDIVIGTAPLDQYSFPSGHTLHAFSFGLHYPTDVLAGAMLGTLLATISLSLFP